MHEVADREIGERHVAVVDELVGDARAGGEGDDVARPELDQFFLALAVALSQEPAPSST